MRREVIFTKDCQRVVLYISPGASLISFRCFSYTSTISLAEFEDVEMMKPIKV